jgi:hypothetical protein
LGRADEGRSATREADLAAIFHKTWQAENPDFLVCRTRQTSAMPLWLPFRPAHE